MEDYDYSRHKYCIVMDLNCETIEYCTLVINRPTIACEKLVKKFASETISTSILYDTATATIIARGDLANKVNLDSKGHYEGKKYVCNIFSELANNYSKAEPVAFYHTALYAVFLQEAINVLQDILHHCKQKLNGSNINFCYSLHLPTSWDYKTKELFRPLFVKAGLIHKKDGQGRLVIFSELESTFHSMQMDTDLMDCVKIKLAKPYIICTLDYQGTCSVDLNLVSAQYPAFTVAGSKLTPQLLKQVRFEMPYGLMEQQLSLVACLEKYCGTTLSPEFIKKMIDIVSQEFENFGFPFSDDPSQGVLSHRPFQYLESHLIKLYGLKKQEIDAIQSISLEDILKSASGPAEKIFKNEMDKFLEGTSNIKTKSMFICFSKQNQRIPALIGLLASIKKWSKAYSEERKKFHKLIVIDRIFGFGSLDKYFQEVANLELVVNQMEEFNMRRDPVILPNNTTTKQPKNCLNPNIFINLDISHTQIKAAFTYLGKDRQVEQKQNIKCNIESLNSFITQSELHQRPILHIKKSLKMRLENIFGDYLKLYSNYNGQRMMIMDNTTKSLNRVLQKKQTKRTLSNFDRIETSENRPKEIRRLFVFSNPNLFKQLTADVNIDDLFTYNDRSCGADNDLFTTCNPAYIFFFVITYLHRLNKRLEENIEKILGTNWRGNNIWYGVSVNKNLLDTVFGSKKKLEKMFYASGILQKDDDLLKAKFCTRGEEIMPAIQHIYNFLNFRLKSFFVVAQVSSKHIQLTLHQVVKLASPEEDAASIIIQDEIINIDYVYDIFCKTLWASIKSNCQVDYCATHKERPDTLYDFDSFQVYRNIHQNLQACVFKLLGKNKVNLDMNSKIQLNMNNKCACSISLFFRDVIEVGLMSATENMATDIVASLTNKELFGKYAPSYIFVFGDPFNLTFGSITHTIYTMIMQKAIDDGVYFKEKDTKTYVLRESVFQLLQLFVPMKKPYMFDRFVTGTLCQVPSETYALRIRLIRPGLSYPSIRVTSNDFTGNVLNRDGSFLVFIQKGKPISTKGFIIQITADKFLHNKRPIVEVLQLDSSKSTVPEKYALLHHKTPGAKYCIGGDFASTLVRKLVVEFAQISNNLIIKVSAGCMVGIDDYINYPYYNSMDIMEPLTLTYI